MLMQLPGGMHMKATVTVAEPESTRESALRQQLLLCDCLQVVWVMYRARRSIMETLGFVSCG
jgi:hypothetical protein